MEDILILRNEIEEMLKESEDLSGFRFFIWGTGNTTSLYQEGLNRLSSEGRITIEGYCDNNSSKWGTQVFGKRVWAPSELMKIADEVLILVSSPQPEIIKAIGTQLNGLGIKWRHIDDYILKSHASEVLSCFDLFDDEKSKRVYAELIRCRLKGCYPREEFIDRDQYFSFRDYGEYDANEVFIDCGAFVGDTIESYISHKDGTFKKIIAFEPDSQNISAMEARLKRLKREWNISDNKIEIFPYGISDKSAVFFVERYDANNGFGSKIVSGNGDSVEECKVVSIDETIKEPYTFLKADIESYEYKLLLGAKATIAKYEPKIAICIYHNAVDFYSIPLLLKQINPHYKFAIRHYTHVMSDSVVYAYTTLSEED